MVGNQASRNTRELGGPIQQAQQEEGELRRQPDQAVTEEAKQNEQQNEMPPKPRHKRHRAGKNLVRGTGPPRYNPENRSRFEKILVGDPETIREELRDSAIGAMMKQEGRTNSKTLSRHFSDKYGARLCEVAQLFGRQSYRQVLEKCNQAKKDRTAEGRCEVEGNCANMGMGGSKEPPKKVQIVSRDQCQTTPIQQRSKSQNTLQCVEHEDKKTTASPGGQTGYVPFPVEESKKGEWTPPLPPQPQRQGRQDDPQQDLAAQKGARKKGKGKPMDQALNVRQTPGDQKRGKKEMGSAYDRAMRWNLGHEEMGSASTMQVESGPAEGGPSSPGAEEANAH